MGETLKALLIGSGPAILLLIVTEGMRMLGNRGKEAREAAAERARIEQQEEELQLKTEKQRSELEALLRAELRTQMADERKVFADQRSQWNEQAKELFKGLQDRDAEIGKLREQIKLQHEHLLAMRERIADANDERTRFEVRIRELENKSNAANEEILRLRKTVADLNAKLETVTKERNELKNRLEEVERNQQQH